MAVYAGTSRERERAADRRRQDRPQRATPELRARLQRLLAEQPHGVTPLTVGREVLCLEGPSALVSRAGLSLLRSLKARRRPPSRRFVLDGGEAGRKPEAEGAALLCGAGERCSGAPSSVATARDGEAATLPTDEGERRLRARARLVEGANASAEVTEALDALPEAPGVYRLLDANGVVLYVGKARSLRARVRSYFSPHADARKRAAELRRCAVGFVAEPLGSELEAMVEELRQIRSIRPAFNVQVAVHRRGRPRGRFLLLLPAGGDTSIELLGLRDGVVLGRARTNRNARPMRPVRALVSSCLRGPSPCSRDPEEDALVCTWFRQRRDRCNFVDLTLADGVEHACRLVRAYAGDPQLFTAKLFLR